MPIRLACCRIAPQHKLLAASTASPAGRKATPEKRVCCQCKWPVVIQVEVLPLQNDICKYSNSCVYPKPPSGDDLRFISHGFPVNGDSCVKTPKYIDYLLMWMLDDLDSGFTTIIHKPHSNLIQTHFGDRSSNPSTIVRSASDFSAEIPKPRSDIEKKDLWPRSNGVSSPVLVDMICAGNDPLQYLIAIRLYVYIYIYMHIIRTHPTSEI